MDRDDGRFDIAADDGRTRVTFTHEGLAAGDECFDVCHDAWRHYITDSLRQRILTGRGTMRTREEDLAAVGQHAGTRALRGTEEQWVRAAQRRVRAATVAG